MNIKRLSLGIVGSAAILGAVGCTRYNTESKAKERALQYLTPAELSVAKEYANKQPSGEQNISVLVDFWDSLNIESKAKQAYFQGRQMVEDSASGKAFVHPDYKLKLDTVINENSKEIKYLSEREYASNTGITAIEYLDNRGKQPIWHEGPFTYDLSNPSAVHYWNLITLYGRQKEAFEQGVEEAKKDLQQSKTTSVIDK